MTMNVMETVRKMMGWCPQKVVYSFEEDFISEYACSTRANAIHWSSVKRKSMIWNADCADDADARGLDYPCKSA